ncbi:MAG TPA: Asp-tRNA(Asn)/Glu-tRNA(Gln) amidotransferase subunit GatB [Burkholderiales bacterium]|nr:Asp-tRNA(Asn)/Glu-tRNA(Gln) amidotransferase subunit GatB [Burkholderiales bacterium]
MSWEVVIGLETHVQLSTVSKVFSGASTAFGAAPNTHASAVDVALPGVLPVLNRGAVERAIRFGLAVNGRDAGNINRRSVFARKNYFYPDLPKGYQISQLDLPVVKGGHITIVSPTRGEIKVRLTRAHLEEDAGKSLHEGLGQDVSGIDLNRAGTPLLEIVSEPDLRSAEEAVAYAKTLHSLVMWIGICDGNMQEGSFRCDANVSIHKKGEPFGTRREIKNLNSFRFLQQAIEYEVQWQISEIEEGRKIQQATVLFDADSGETRSMRTKEDAHDYRYFPDPDLLPLSIGEDWINQVRGSMPESQEAKQKRYQSDFGLVAADAAALTSSREMAKYYEDILAEEGANAARAKTAANWVINDLSAALNKNGLSIEQSPIAPHSLAKLLSRIQDGTLSGKMAKEVFDAMWSGEGEPDAIIEKRGLKQMSDSGAIEKIVDEVLAANPKSVEEFRAGKEKAFNALVGQVMKASKGKANPAQVNEILKKKLAATE